jgi:hypothetical protein
MKRHDAVWLLKASRPWLDLNTKAAAEVLEETGA